jgi:glycosyltransferase involved in cell wall biosynthesis
MKRKLLIVHHSGLLGGAGLSLEALLHELTNDYDVVSYLPASPPDLATYLAAKHYNIRLFNGRLGKLTIYSGGNSFWSFRFLYHAIKIAFQFRKWSKLIARERPDVLIVNSRVLVWFGLIRYPVAKVCFIRETVNRTAPFAEAFIIRPLLRRFDARVFLSEFDRRESGISVDADGVSPDHTPDPNFRVIERGAARNTFGLRSTDFVLAFVGGVDPIKGLGVLLEAVGALTRRTGNPPRGISILVCGDISSAAFKRYERLYSAATRVFIQNALNGKGALSQCIVPVGLVADLSQVYSAADVLVFPMERPHQSRPAFEIGYFRKPVIISDFPNVAEFYKHEYNVLTFEPNDPVSLAAAIDRLATDEKLLRTLGMNNYAESQRIRTAEACIQPVRRILNKLTASSPRRACGRTEN